MTLREIIESKLQASLAPTALEIVDDSHQHAGHGASGAHVAVVITSAKFSGKSLVQRHRLVNDALREELQSGAIHALQITARAPEEHT